MDKSCHRNPVVIQACEKIITLGFLGSVLLLVSEIRLVGEDEALHKVTNSASWGSFALIRIIYSIQSAQNTINDFRLLIAAGETVYKTNFIDSLGR